MIGNIYRDPVYWDTFVVIRQISKDFVEIKLLNRPNYYSYDLKKYGYAKISARFLDRCTLTTDGYDIAELIKYFIIPKT